MSFAAPENPDQLNQQGFDLLRHGDAPAALETWRQATEAYLAEGNEEGVKGTKVNQALARQTLGLYPEACRDLTEVLSLPPNLCQSDFSLNDSNVKEALSKVEVSSVTQIGLRILGENFRLFGSPHEAEAVLLFAKDATWPDNLDEESRIILALGSAYGLSAQEGLHTLSRLGLADAQSAKETISTVKTKVQQAIDQFELAAAKSAGSAVQAHLNILNLFADVNSKVNSLPSWMGANLDFPILQNAAEKSYSLSQGENFDNLPSNESIDARLSFANSLLTILRTPNHSEIWNAIDLSTVNSVISKATALSKEAGNYRALSLAIGLSADLGEYQKISFLALERLRIEALAIAQSIQADDISYEWSYKLAKVQEAQGKVGKAEQSYQQAISSLAQVRQDLIAVNTELRFDFKEKIEPVYRDYIKLLVASNEPDTLSQVVHLYESLQLAELENFLRCGRLIGPSSNTSREGLVLYVINLVDYVEVVASSPTGYYGYSLPANKVLTAAQNLTLNVQSPSFLTIPESKFLPYAQSLYTALVAPLEGDFISDGTPLTFVLDYPFQNIPMGILHDGENYLIKNHVINNSLRLSRSPDSSQSSQALFVGLTKETTSDDPRISATFGPLPETEFEAEALKSTVRSTIFLDKEFTEKRLIEALNTKDYKIVHISTHGQFSSAPDDTYLVAWDELIDTQDLARIFQGNESDLLVLSACQTASGDDRAVLGLSGVAIQAGAHSVIASLWLVDVTGGSVLFDFFYQQLAQGIETAEALHQAQITLLESTDFNHPFYWASFILVKES